MYILPLTEKAKTARLRDIQRCKFFLFDKEYICPTMYTLRTKFQLKKAVADCDSVVCGSDQIWSPLLYDKHYFLDFVDGSKKRKIAFAPSFGVVNLGALSKKIADYLNDFHSISVRESVGQTIIESLPINKPCTTILDPTMLVDVADWNKISSSIDLPKKYIMCYFLGKNIPDEFISGISKEQGCTVVNVTSFTTMNYVDGAIALNTLSPSEFIYAIKNADCILTDSFHASVFSILNKKPFYTFNKHANSDSSNQNSRIYNLLDKLGLTCCHIVNVKNMRIRYPEIDYVQVEKNLQILRKQSIDFLNEALK